MQHLRKWLSAQNYGGNLSQNTRACWPPRRKRSQTTVPSSECAGSRENKTMRIVTNIVGALVIFHFFHPDVSLLSFEPIWIGWTCMFAILAWFTFTNLAFSHFALQEEVQRLREGQEEPRDDCPRSAEDSYRDYFCSSDYNPTRSRPISSPPTLPLGWVSIYCSECGRQYNGVNESEAKRTLDWHTRANHALCDCSVPDKEAK
jgi:hypothetical protein